MEIKYFTPFLSRGSWRMTIPPHQRTTGGTASSERIFLPEGVHTIKIMWEGEVSYILRQYGTVGGSTHRDLTDGFVDPVTRKSVIREIVSPPGGTEITLWMIKLITSDDVISPKIIHAGVTVFLGTNET